MKCIYCNYKDTSVKNSRLLKPSNMVWRRRECENCNTVFTTHERVEIGNFFVIKRNFTKKRFVYEKMFSSILLAVLDGKHVDVGDAVMAVKNICEDIIQTSIQENKSKIISTKEIIIRVYKQLEKENKMWALRYGFYSEYRKKVLKSYIK